MRSAAVKPQEKPQDRYDRTHTMDDTAMPTRPAAELEPLASTRQRDPARYAIIGEHGRGGLGCVLRAHDRDLGRDVAIKELISRGELTEVRFMREALITARLEHPGIVPVHEAGRWPNGTPFYAMKLVAGRSLHALLAERTTVEQRIALLHHVIAVADAIAYAHGRNIIHRDLKPANVIVGDFGETVVIDWGLAKDLSGDDDAAPGEARASGDHDDGLTTTGLVLGTPAYMAPEQARGEHVDQRADVFALGAMLWELCTLDKLQPADRQLRHRVLRRAGIDRDLVAIIDKAIEPEPARRYRDAGALAADLKAFRSGARIAARSYSLLAVLGHWARRRRALAVSIAAAVVVAMSGTALYVRNVAIERDRAEASNSRLVLEQADQLLHSDPSKAFELLATYRGSDVPLLQMLRAKARGLGVARLRAQPHTQGIYFAHALDDGTVLTLAGDGTVATTTPDGRSKVIARGVTPQYTFAYSQARHVLAYACNATAICLLDVVSGTLRAPPSDRPALAPTCLQFSPDDDELAALTPRGELTVWQLAGERAPVRRYSDKFASGDAIRFIDDDTLAVETGQGMHILHLPAAGSAVPALRASFAGLEHITTAPPLRLMAAATAAGALAVFDGRTDEQLASAAMCSGPVNRIALLGDGQTAAFACQDGDAGIVDVRTRTRSVLTHLDGGATSLAASGDGQMLLFGGGRGQIAIYDAATQMVSSRLGHSTRISVLLPPSIGFPYIVSCDDSGALRVWSPPEAMLRVAARSTTRMFEAAPLAHGPVIAVSFDATIPWSARDGKAGLLDGHNTWHTRLATSPAAARFALFGTDEDVELWSLDPGPAGDAGLAGAPGAPLRTLRSQHGAVTAVAFAAEGERLLVGHRDGTISELASPGAAPRDLGTIHDAVDLVRVCPHSGVAIITGAGGALWLARDAGLVELAAAGEPVTSLACAPSGRQLVVGTAGGNVWHYDLATHRRTEVFGATSWIELVEFSADGRSIAVSSSGKLRMVAVDGARPSLELDASYATFSPDNRWLAAISDHGDLWFHRAADGRWVYLATGIAKVSPAAFSDDGKQFVATDPGGRALVVDLTSAAFE